MKNVYVLYAYTLEESDIIGVFDSKPLAVEEGEQWLYDFVKNNRDLRLVHHQYEHKAYIVNSYGVEEAYVWFVVYKFPMNERTW